MCVTREVESELLDQSYTNVYKVMTKIISNVQRHIRTSHITFLRQTVLTTSQLYAQIENHYTAYPAKFPSSALNFPISIKP